MTQPRHLNPVSVRQFWLACWFALALLSFQTLGHLHRHAHAHGGAATTAALDSWGHQSGDLSCQLFDQLSQDHAPVAPFTADTLVAANLLTAALPWANAASASHWRRGARGPPLRA